MKALTYIEHGKFALVDKPKPKILDPRDAIARVTLGSTGSIGWRCAGYRLLGGPNI